MPIHKTSPHSLDSALRTGLSDVDEQQRTACSTQHHESAQVAELAECSKCVLTPSGELTGTIVTGVLSPGTFNAAEDCHQKRYQRNPPRWRFGASPAAATHA